MSNPTRTALDYLRCAELDLLSVSAMRRTRPVDVLDLERALDAIERLQRRIVEETAVPLVLVGFVQDAA